MDFVPLASVSPLLSTQNQSTQGQYALSFLAPNNSNFMGINPGASNPVNAAMTDASSTTSLTPPMTTNGIVPNPMASSFFPQAPGTTPPSSSGLGMNTGTLQLALGGIGMIGQLWNAWQANKLAEKQFEFSKDFAVENLENQTQNYNTTLENHSNARGGYEGWDRDKTRSYIQDHKLDKPKF